MPVPTWSAIPDSMVAPEAPVSSDLMTRLRDQWASFMGVDPEAVSQPAFTLPASYQKPELEGLFSANGSLASPITTSEIQVATVADDVEDIVTGTYMGTVYDSVDTNWDGLCGNVFTYKSSATTIGPNVATLVSMGVNYSAGAPTGMTFKFNTSDGGFISATVTSNNTYQNIFTAASGVALEGKVRTTSTQVFLTLRCTQGSGAYMALIRVPFVTKSFKSKA